MRRTSFKQDTTLMVAVAAGLMLSATAASAQKTEVPGVGHTIGDPNAPILVVEFADFACEACAGFAVDTWPEIHREFIATGKVRWQMVPFELGFKNSEEGARAGECAAGLGKFWEMHDLMFHERDTWVDDRKPNDELAELAVKAGIDEEAFRECYDDEPYEDRTKSSNKAAKDAGVRGTPTYFVDGFQVQGALPTDQFLQLIAERVAGGSD